MELHTLTRSRGLKTSRRVGRGGKRGKTSGRGGKGQTARAGAKLRPEWRDIIKKIPKRRGYGRNRSRTVIPQVGATAVSLDALSKAFKDGAVVTPIACVKAGLARRIGGKAPVVKVLGKGTLDKKLNFEGVLVSKTALVAIEKAGGTVKSKAVKA